MYQFNGSLPAFTPNLHHYLRAEYTHFTLTLGPIYAEFMSTLMLLDTHFTDAELHKLTMLYPKVDTCWWVAKLTAGLQQLDHSFRAHHAPQQAIEEQPHRCPQTSQASH